MHAHNQMRSSDWPSCAFSSATSCAEPDVPSPFDRHEKQETDFDQGVHLSLVWLQIHGLRLSKSALGGDLICGDEQGGEFWQVLRQHADSLLGGLQHVEESVGPGGGQDPRAKP